MKKAIYLLGLIVVGVVAYQVGWRRSIQHQTIGQALAQGEEDLAVFNALQTGDQNRALNLLEASIRRSYVTLYSSRENIPKPFVEPVKLFSARTLGRQGMDPSIGEGAPRLPWGTRGYLLKLPEASTSGLGPGDYADISVTFGSKALRNTTPVVRHVLVIGIGQEIDKHQSQSAVSLAVTPEEAKKLEEAQQKDYAVLSIEKTQPER